MGIQPWSREVCGMDNIKAIFPIVKKQNNIWTLGQEKYAW